MQTAPAPAMPPYDIDSPYSLSPDAIAAFRRDGFVKLKDVFDREALAWFGEQITAQTIALNTETRPLEERDTYDRAFLQVMNLWEFGGAPRDFVFGRRLARIAAELLGTEGVRLYHDQSLYKEPGGGITPAHADQYYWPLSNDRSVTAWVPLQAVPREMGPLAFYAGSQNAELGRDLPISDESEARITAAMEAQGFPIVDQPFDLGEVSFHRGWTFHKAGANVSDRPRSVMTVIYMDRDVRLAEPTNNFQQADWEKWAPGAELGQVIDTPLNPVLWERAS